MAQVMCDDGIGFTQFALTLLTKRDYFYKYCTYDLIIKHNCEDFGSFGT